MKKDRSNQKLTKADFEKFACHDTRFYGLFYTKTDNGIKVKIDPKRMRNTVGGILSDEQIKIINRRRTHYFYPKKSKYEEYCCNMFADRIRDIQNYWEEHYKKLIIYAKKRIKKPKKAMPGNNMLFIICFFALTRFFNLFYAWFIMTVKE